MVFNIAQSASRNNIEPVFWFVTVPVMILLGLIVAIITLQSFRIRQLACNNGIAYGHSGLCPFRITSTATPTKNLSFFGMTEFLSRNFYTFWITTTVTSCFPPAGNFSFFGLQISSLRHLKTFASRISFCSDFIFFTLAMTFSSRLRFWGFRVNLITHFTGRVMSVFRSLPFVKFRNWFDLLALRTGLLYDYIRHNFSPIKVMLEPFVGYVPQMAHSIICDLGKNSK